MRRGQAKRIGVAAAVPLVLAACQPLGPREIVPLPKAPEVTTPPVTAAIPVAETNRVRAAYARLTAVDQEKVALLYAKENGLLVTRDGNEQDLFWEELERLGWSRAVPTRPGDPAAARIWGLTDRGRRGLDPIIGG